jgi:hypothetical protein
MILFLFFSNFSFLFSFIFPSQFFYFFPASFLSTASPPFLSIHISIPLPCLHPSPRRLRAPACAMEVPGGACRPTPWWQPTNVAPIFSPPLHLPYLLPAGGLLGAAASAPTDLARAPLPPAGPTRGQLWQRAGRSG